MQVTVELRVPETPLFKGDPSHIVQEELVAATEYGVMAMEAAIVPLTPIDTGGLRGGVQTSVTGTPAGVLGRVFNPLGHALAQELGTKPFFPPPAALEPWVRRKLRVAEKEVRSVAFLVARAISRRGLPARTFFARGFAQARERALGAYEQATARIVARLGGKA